MFWLSDEHAVLAARLENALLGTLAVAGVWWLARQLFGPRAAIAAAALAALYPESVAAKRLILSDTPFCALMLLQFGLWAAAWKVWKEGTVPICATTMQSWCPPSGRPEMGTVPSPGLLSLAAGLAAGAATRSTQLVAVHSLGRGGCRAARPTSRLKRIGMGMAMVAAMSLVLAPWWLRNASVTGHFVPTTLQVGASLYDGLSPTPPGPATCSPRQRSSSDSGETIPSATTGDGAVEYTLDQQLAGGVGWAANIPREAIRLAGIKFLRTWNLWPNEASFSAWPVRLAVAVTYVPLLILGLVGGVRTFASRLAATGYVGFPRSISARCTRYSSDRFAIASRRCWG